MPHRQQAAAPGVNRAASPSRALSGLWWYAVSCGHAHSTDSPGGSTRGRRWLATALAWVPGSGPARSQSPLASASRPVAAPHLPPAC
jgi:hypothetical protein